MKSFWLLPQSSGGVLCRWVRKGFVTDASYAKGVQITTTMHANTVPVAEVTIALTFLPTQWFSQDQIRRALPYVGTERGGK